MYRSIMANILLSAKLTITRHWKQDLAPNPSEVLHTTHQHFLWDKSFSPPTKIYLILWNNMETMVSLVSSICPPKAPWYMLRSASKYFFLNAPLFFSYPFPSFPFSFFLTRYYYSHLTLQCSYVDCPTLSTSYQSSCFHNVICNVCGKHPPFHLSWWPLKLEQKLRKIHKLL